MIVSGVDMNPSEIKMTDMLIKCDRFDCTVSPQTPKGERWMKNNVSTCADSNIAKVSSDVIKDFEKNLDKDGITYEYTRRC